MPEKCEPGQDRSKITPDKTGKHKVEKTDVEQATKPPTDKKTGSGGN